MRNLHTSRSSSSKETSVSSTPSARVPFDRSNPMAPSSSRQQPQMPTLARRTPATPKVAPKLAARPSATAATAGPQRQTVTLATPAPRRAARPDSVLSQSTSSNLGGNSNRREPLPSREGIASPVPAYRQSSVTPRARSRQGRINSATSSPNPTDAAVDNWETRSGLGISGPPHDAEPLRRSGPAPTSAPRDSKFFYASDASKGAQPTSQPVKPPTSQPKGPTFFYANGEDLPSKPGPNVAPSAPFSPTLPASSPDALASKFMYANGTPDLKPSLMTSGSGSVVSTSSRAPSGRAGSGPQSPVFVAQRAPSPPKASSSHAHPPQLPTSGPSIAERRSMFTSTPQLGQSNMTLKRVSSDGPPRRTSGHSRAGSAVVEPPSVARVMAASPPATSPLPSPLSFNNPGLSLASVLQAAEELEDHTEPEDDESLASGLASPKSASGNDPLNELVANARRERKVQDLQITNASLEAINRTLERQLRKQTNELRRYKRLSRAGRLSSANTAPASRVPSDSTMGENPEGPLNSLSLSDLSEEGSDLDADDEDLESELSESSTGSAQMSPEAVAVRDSHHRRHEKRLQVDLSKHQQLLVDSQRMNQSLKRCLGWTEELISEGKRALAYQVRVSEIDAGDRAAPEEGEQPYIYDGAQLWDHEHSEQSPTEELMDGDDQTDESDDGEADKTVRLRIERLRPADETDGNKSAQDRDSGIVLPGDSV